MDSKLISESWEVTESICFTPSANKVNSTRKLRNPLRTNKGKPLPTPKGKIIELIERGAFEVFQQKCDKPSYYNTDREDKNKSNKSKKMKFRDSKVIKSELQKDKSSICVEKGGMLLSGRMVRENKK